MAHTDVALTGNFSSSDALLNTIHDMTQRTILSLTGIPTNTPMYEKRGWFGDAQIYPASAATPATGSAPATTHSPHEIA